MIVELVMKKKKKKKGGMKENLRVRTVMVK